MSKFMALKPRLSEKAYAQSLQSNVYTFTVPMTANKLTIADAVNAQFKVTVGDVHISVAKGKQKRSYSKRRRPAVGRRADVKKAYVRIKDGETINIFGEPEQAAEKTKAKEAAQPDKKVAVDTKPKGRLRTALGRAPRQTQNKGGDK